MFKKNLTLFVFIFPFLMFFCSALHAEIAGMASPAIADGANGQTESAYIVGPQNIVQIKIFGEGSVSQIYQVDELGFIKHALCGSVKLGGLTVAEAEKMMESKLAGDYILNPKVTIFILQHSHFSIIGEVRKPGSYEILGRVSVIEAISMAGGFMPTASQSGVKIIRKREGRESTIPVDTKRITGRGDVSANVYIEADDVIVIPKSFF